MTRMATFSSPLFLGFEELERALEQVARSASDGYPPYNIERIRTANADGQQAIIRITLAVAGFTTDDLDIVEEEKKLTIRGKQTDDGAREFLHRGIAARQFQRAFVLADGIEVQSADLKNGLLMIDLVRLEPERLARKISITSSDT